MILSPGLMLLCVVLITVVAIYAQFRVQSVISKFSRVPTRRRSTGAEVAAEILRDAGIYDVEIKRAESFLGDHYDPSKKALCLSPDVHDGASVAAAGIAAHECGHAIQHQQGYAPLKARMMIVPVTQVASTLLPFIVIGGFYFGLFRYKPILDLGILVYAVLTVFQLITLPVEFDASRRAKLILTQRGIVTADEAAGVNTVLSAAALTYVAAFLSSLFHLLRLVMMRNRD
jgi:Zn-dependent membrane protease YugP